jgi:hypothetical protein
MVDRIISYPHFLNDEVIIMTVKEYIDVEIIILEDAHTEINDEHIELLLSFDIVTRCEYENVDITIYEDFSVCYPPEKYDDILNFLKALPDDSYSFKIFNDEDDVIKQYGDLEVERDDVFVFNEQYN